MLGAQAPVPGHTSRSWVKETGAPVASRKGSPSHPRFTDEEAVTTRSRGTMRPRAVITPPGAMAEMS